MPVPNVMNSASAACRWLWISLSCLLFLGLSSQAIYSLYQQHESLEAITDVRAQEIASANPVLAASDAWSDLELPEKLCRRDCRHTYKIYRSGILLPDENEPWAIYLPGFDGSAAVYIDGIKIGESGSMKSPIADMTYQPTLFEIPKGHTGTVALDIVVASLVARGGRLLPFHVAALSDLKLPHWAASTTTVRVLTISNSVFLLIAFFALALFSAGDRDRLYLWFTLLLAFAALRNANVLLPEWPPSPVIRNFLYLTATLGALLSTAAWIVRLTEQRQSTLDIKLIAVMLPASAFMLAALSTENWVDHWVSINAVIRIVSLVLGPLLLFRFLRHTGQLPILLQSIVFALLSVAFVLVAHDSIMAWPPRILVFQLSNLATLPLVLCFFIYLSFRFVDYLQKIRQLEMERDNAAALLAKPRVASSPAQMIRTERQRIMQDMHDGVGGRLASLIQQLRRRDDRGLALADELQLSLQDLRLIIDSLDPALTDNLAVALGTFRARIQPLLDNAGVHLTWDINIDRIDNLQASDVLNLYRCLQEAVHNALRHASPNRIEINGRSLPDSLRLSVINDGLALSRRAGAGRGLNIMAERSRRLGGRFELSSDGSLTTASFDIPTPINRGSDHHASRT